MSGGFGSSTQETRRITELERRLSALENSGGTSPGVSLGTFTLATSGTSTTVTDASVSAASKILWAPTSDAAMSLEGAIRITPGAGSFSVTHVASSLSRTYNYVAVTPA